MGLNPSQFIYQRLLPGRCCRPIVSADLPAITLKPVAFSLVVQLTINVINRIIVLISCVGFLSAYLVIYRFFFRTLRNENMAVNL